MHTLMSFLSSIGKLMKASGIENLISAAFGGLANILAAKVWINSFRAFRMVVAALLQEFFSTGPKTHQEIEEYLERTRLHPTGRFWVDCFVKPTLLALMFLRSQRTGDFLLQQYCLERMVPYYFATGHQNHARYMSWYLRQMQNIPQEAKKDLMSGSHVCIHSDGGTAVPGDQFGEQTYVKRGKGAGGLKGMSTSPEQVTVWVNSFSICASLDIAFDDMYDDKDESKQRLTSVDQKHPQEGERRRQLDEDDRRKIEAVLCKNSHPLNEKHEKVANILHWSGGTRSCECPGCTCHWNRTKCSVLYHVNVRVP